MQNFREDIDKLDGQIVQLLSKRFELCKKIGQFKKANNLPILNEKREREILEKMPSEETKQVYLEILRQSRDLQE